MGIFGGSKDKQELGVIFDIGSSSVGGALFLMKSSGIPKVIFSIREPIVVEQKVEIESLLLSTLKSLDFVAGKISGAGLGVPKKVFCVLSSPWYASQTRIVTLQKNTPFIFNSKLADTLTEKEVNIFKEEHKAKYPNAPGFRMIELKHIKTMLNGYATPNPSNQKAKELEMTIFISMSPEPILAKIEETIGRYFYHKNIKFSSCMMAFFAVVRDMFAKEENFLLVHIGGELTDISMIKNSILRESVSFPLGLNFIIRGVAEGLNCSVSEARSFISLYKDGHIAEPTNQKLEPIINKLKTEWLKGFQESLANLSNDISIPATVFTAVYKEFAEFFGGIVKTEQFNQYTLTDSKFQITFLDTVIFNNSIIFAENVVRDPFLAIEAIYINRFMLKE